MTKKEQPLLEKPGKTSEPSPAVAQDGGFVSSLPSSTAMTAPSYQALDRGKTALFSDNNVDDETLMIPMCRICLETDDSHTMIAPCRCKGGSRWVHRQCLDEWRIHETDRAFSKCTECLFEYHLQQQPTPLKRFRKTKYYLMMTRDLCGAHLAFQLLIAIFGWMASAIDVDRSIPPYINPDYPVAVYYLVGFLSVLCLLGVYGTVHVCGNGCSVKAALQGYPELGLARTGEQPSYEDRREHYQARRRAQRTTTSRGDDEGQTTSTTRQGQNCCTHNCGSCYYYPSPYYYGDPGGCCDCCCWCCKDQAVGSPTTSISQGGDSGGDCCQGCGGGNGNENGAEILLIILLVFAVVMAIIGFLVGMVVVVVIFQRTAQRHAYLIHKQQLTSEFQVVDLSGYDLDRPLGRDEEEATNLVHPPPSAPPLPEKDTIYLKNMGLME